ncbi:type IV pili methyl-accepting chemotaxis transducer N-terminal domain-containing protein [Aidingimonas halophila]|uniref:Sensor protein n=1 Tax=Aidingimonas halophila TaxID=574349 RepID=A0A1H2WY15_9GAMM|nr:type IV pili methyl-accepting chemotaxis transducer N-terminal domain-containing protein [Aidingimonas halophila]GHC27781.1 histidine kinase [Aidingimonas halophila]SDW85406.1 two-component system, NarL family, nitrate/nitrite sensor histidine kinase NarX [Aidingimonas halophila]
MKPLKRSLVARIMASILAISALALISIVVTIMVADDSRGDAAAINIAGSLRMNTTQIESALMQYRQRPDADSREQVENLLNRFEERLGHTALVAALPASEEHRLQQQYRRIQTHWHEALRPRIESILDGDRQAHASLATPLDNQVSEIDSLVARLEAHTESKIGLLHGLQYLFLGLTIAVMVVVLFDIRHRLIFPLRQLMVSAKEVTRRNFRHRTGFTGDDELARLGRTFDTMASELATSYAELEDRVSHKTRELERSNRVMQVLHDGSRSLYGGGNDLCSSAAPMLRKLESLLDIGPIKLSVNDPVDRHQIPILATHSAHRPEYCRDHDCHACLIDPEPIEFKQSGDAECLLLPVSVGSELLGTLEVWHSRRNPLSTSSKGLLNTLCDQLATAIYLQRRIEHQQQVSLMNERTIIARELHDSLAQSLSYLKIQVARLERMQDKETPRDVQAAVFDELRTGLNSAYRQLRELLTTFRLKLDGPGLHSVIHQTVDEFSERLGFPVELHYDVPPYLLNPNEEIHVLQIVREALANTHKHAQAHWAAVTIWFEQARLRMHIEDDGIGLGDDLSASQHYGLVIMRDRAHTLGGELALYNRDTRGVRIALDFTPQTARLINETTTRDDSLMAATDRS